MRVLTVRVVMVVTYYQGSMGRSIEGTRRFVTRALRLLQIDVAVMPTVRRRILQLRLNITLNVDGYTPGNDLLTGQLRVFGVVINRVTRFLRRLLLNIKVLVNASIRCLTARRKILTLRVLLRRPVRGLMNLKVRRIRVVRTVFLKASFQLMVNRNRQVNERVCLKSSISTVLLYRLLRFSRLDLKVTTVLYHRSQVNITFRTRNHLNLYPVVARVLSRSIVVRVGLRNVRLMVERRLSRQARVERQSRLSTTVRRRTSRPMNELVLN